MSHFPKDTNNYQITDVAQDTEEIPQEMSSFSLWPAMKHQPYDKYHQLVIFMHWITAELDARET